MPFLLLLLPLLLSNITQGQLFLSMLYPSKSTPKICFVNSIASFTHEKKISLHILWCFVKTNVHLVRILYFHYWLKDIQSILHRIKWEILLINSKKEKVKISCFWALFFDVLSLLFDESIHHMRSAIYLVIYSLSLSLSLCQEISHMVQFLWESQNISFIFHSHAKHNTLRCITDFLSH